MPATQHSIDRRKVLGLMGGCSSAALLAGCGGGDEGSTQSTSAPAKNPGSGGADSFQIPDPAQGFPDDKVSLHWVEGSAFSKAVIPTFLKAYKSKHSNVSVKYDNLPQKDLIRTLQLSFKSGDAPDVFRLIGPVMPGSQAVKQKLVQPLDDIIPDFENWKKSFPEGSFTDGINVFDKKTYPFPMLGQFAWTLQYNRKLLEKAEVDPKETPLSLDTFRETAKKITKNGKGEYVGLVIGGSAADRWSITVRDLGNLCGAVGDEFDYRRGTYNYTSDAYKTVIDWLLAMKSDKSIDPAATSIDTNQARGKLPAGKGAMILNETGIVPRWIKENPDFEFDMAPLPAGDPDEPSYLTYDGPPGGFYWVGANTEATAVIGDMLHYLGTLDAMKVWQTVGGGGIPVSRPKANQVKSLDKRLRWAYDYFDKTMKTRPAPEARNSDVSIVEEHKKSVSPDLGTLVQGIFTGQVSNMNKALKKLQDKSERSLDDAISAARKKGAEVSRDDWVFPNWDPKKSYTQADYEAL